MGPRSIYGHVVDPIYNDATTQQNIGMNTVFESQGLVLIAVSWSWAVALKLIRYRKDDPSDIAAILSLGTQVKGCQWTVELLQSWLLNLCSPMGYHAYPPEKIHETQLRMKDAIKRAQQLPWAAVPSVQYQTPPQLVPFRRSDPQQSSQRHSSAESHARRPSTVHEGMFEHQSRRENAAGERFASSRQRTRSFSGPLSAHPAAVPMPVPPPPPLPPLPAQPPSYDIRHVQRRHTPVYMHRQQPPSAPPVIPAPLVVHSMPPRVVAYHVPPAPVHTIFQPPIAVAAPFIVPPPQPIVGPIRWA